MKCDRDCFNCKYPDCIVGLTRHKNPADRRKYNHDYYVLNRDYLKAKSRERSAKKRELERMAKELTCCNCGADLDKPMNIVKYKGKSFCDTECLGEYLVSQIEDDIDVVWHDTEENMRICAEEEKWER